MIFTADAMAGIGIGADVEWPFEDRPYSGADVGGCCTASGWSSSGSGGERDDGETLELRLVCMTNLAKLVGFDCFWPVSNKW